MTIDEYTLIADLFGKKRSETRPAESKTSTIVGVATSGSALGSVRVRLNSDLTGGEDGELVIPTDAHIVAGDVVSISLVGGTAKAPRVTGTVGGGDRIYASLVETQQLVAEKADITDLTAATARIGDLEASALTADSATITALQADTAKVHDLTANELSAATGYVGDLVAGNLTAANLISDHQTIGSLDVSQISADHATIASLDSNYAQIDLANIANGTIKTAMIDDGQITSAKILNGTIETAKIKDGAITTAKIGDAQVTNAKIANAAVGTANIQNAAITTALIADEAVGDSQIGSVSANKLTAGTIDASNITVTNLNASNITAGSITVDGITIDVENNSAVIDGDAIEDGTITMSGLAQDVRNVIDGAIETHTGTVVPTLNNTPASSWSTNALKDQHVGDVYYVVNSQSQQNGYCYRFTKSGSTYSWQLIKDSDVTAALSRLQTAEGKIGQIETFDSTVSSFMTNTDSELTSVKNRTTSLETRVTTAEGNISNKVDSSTFNTVSQKVDANEANITSLSTVVTNNGLTESTNITNTVNSVSQTATGNSSKISQLTTTLGTNADGTTKAGDIVHRTSAVEQDLSGFKTTVSQTYATQTDLATTNGNVTNAQTDATKALERQTAYSATSSTGATTAAKVASCTNFPTLAAGATVTVRFSTANTSTGAITLNVNSTGAKTVYVNGAATSSSNQLLWATNANITFTYDGTYWRVDSEPRSWYGTGSVAAATAAKTATINEIVVCKGTSVTLNMTYENTSDSATLNVTSTGAKNIYYGTTTTRPTTANGYGWGAGSTVTLVFDGAYWRIGDTTALARLTTAEGVISSHTTSLEQTASAIALKASQSDLDTLSGRVTTAESNITQNADNIELKVSKDGVISSINQSSESVTINANKVNIEGAAIFTGNGRLSSTSLNNAYDSKGSASAAQSAAISAAASDATSKANAAQAAAISAAATDATNKANAANSQEQLIYCSKASGTTSLSATTTWVTATGDTQNAWTLRRPTYSQSYPVLFVATQRKTVGGTVTCTTPQIDNTTTVIDGGNIITGSVTANKLNAADINASNSLTVGAFTSAAQSDILNSNVQIGGRNLLLQSQLFGTAEKTNRIVGKYNNELLVSRADGFNEIQANANFRGISVYANSMGFAVGEKLILSTNVRSDSTVGTNLTFYCMAFNASGTRIQSALLHLKARTGETDYTSINIYANNSFLAGAEERIVVEITWLQAAQDLLDAGGTINFTIQATSSDWSKGNVAMWAPKLERGNVATDWTPAPEDIQAEALDAEQQIYIQAASVSDAPTVPSAWVEESGESIAYGTQGDASTITTVWTTKHPTYDRNRPVTFVATQRKRLDGTITCSNPLPDDTTTIIDGGNIITGSVTANKLNAADINASNSLTVGAFTSAAQSDILNSNVQIGGRNLLLGSKTQDTSLGNYRNGAVETTDKFLGCTVFKTSAAWDDIGFNFKTQIVDRGLVNAGDVLTYSIYAKTDDTTTREIHGVWIANSAGGNHIGGVKIANLTSSWVRYQKQITVTQAMLDSATVGLATRFECNTACTSGKYIYWAAPKLEKGNVATDWTPAPEDVAAIATNYITEVANDGIWVTPSSAKPSNGSAVSTTSGWHIASAIELFRLGVSYIKLWVENSIAKVRIGVATGKNVVIDNDSVDICDGTTVKASIDENGLTVNGKMNFRDVLYDNASGTNGTITLSQSAANYNHMRIHTKTNYGHGSLDVPNPNGKDVLLLSMATDNSGVTTMYFIQQSRCISGTTISVNHSGYAWMVSRSASATNTGVNAENYMYVVRVEAWNE